MKNNFDVIVVGAGPAGSMAAKISAEKGIDVLLLEKDPVIGYPLCCAEAISLYGLSRSVEIDKRWITARINHVLLQSPLGTSFCLNHPQAGVILDRKIFDRDLACYASEAGAEVKVGAWAHELIKADKGKIIGLKVKENQKEDEYFTKIIIAADGIESQIGKWAGLNTTLKLDQFDSATQYLLGNLDIESDTMEFHFGQNLAPGGYAWVFPKGKNCANVGLAVTPSLTKEEKAKDYLDRFIQKRFSKFNILEFMMGGVPVFNEKLPLVRENVLLVGDAARVVDSLSGAGIANALLSGKIAGEITAEFIKGKNLPLSFLRKYPQEFFKVKGRELRIYHLCRRIYLKMKDQDFDLAINFLNNYFGQKTVRRIDPLGIIKTFLKSNPKLLLLARHLVR